MTRTDSVLAGLALLLAALFVNRCHRPAIEAAAELEARRDPGTARATFGERDVEALRLRVLLRRATSRSDVPLARAPSHRTLVATTVTPAIETP